MTAPSRITRHAIAGAAIGCVAALAAACGTSSPSAGPATTATTASPAPSASPSQASTAAASPTPVATPAGAGGAAACPTRSLAAKIGVSQGTAGSVYIVLDFTNIGTVTCTLYGYPGVSLAGGTPVKQIGLAATESKVTARTLVTLAPRQVANALLQVVDAGNFPPAKCGLVTAHYLQIFPPNQTTPIYLGFSSAACSKPVQILNVSVVVAGAGSSA